jgi:hypothetical protein
MHMMRRRDKGTIKMKDDWGPLRAPFFGGLAIGISVGVVGLLILPAFTADAYCIEGETPIACFREWWMMVGTWAAAGVGLGAAYFVYRTIVMMSEQLAEMRRQTNYIVGDDHPVVDLAPLDALESGKFRITNLNRRPFIIMAVEWTSSVDLGMFPEFGTEGAAIPGMSKRSIRLTDDGMLTRTLEMPGWADRSGPPPVMNAFVYVVYGGDDAEIPELTRQGVTARLWIHGYLVGNVREPIKIWCEAPLGHVVGMNMML